MNKFKKILALFALTFVMQNFTLALMPPKRDRSQIKPTLTLDLYSLANKLNNELNIDSESGLPDINLVTKILNEIISNTKIIDNDKSFFKNFLSEKDFSDKALKSLKKYTKKVIQKLNKKMIKKSGSFEKPDRPVESKIKKQKDLTLPEQRKANKETGMLQELLIEGGYFEFSRFLIDFLNINNKIKELLDNKPTNKKQLNKWKYEHASLNTQKTDALKNLKIDIEEYIKLYVLVCTQNITTVQQNELDRMVKGSLESIPSLYDQISNTKNTIKSAQSALETVEYHKINALKSLAAGLIEEDWETITLPDLIEDTNKLTYLLNSTEKFSIENSFIWNNLINLEMIIYIFDTIREKENGHEMVKKIAKGLEKEFGINSKILLLI